MWFDADGPRGELRGPLAVPGPDEGTLDVRARLLTQHIADSLALGIARHPQDWHMLQRLWLDEPVPAAPETATPDAAGRA
jgi:KDO2-lipid IV(A) lauroyltransferase